MITREMLTEHLANLETKFSQMATEANVLQGAIISDRYWLSILDSKKETPEPEKPIA